MNYFHVSILVTLLVNLILGILVFTAGTKRRLNQMFLLSSVVTIYWLLSLLGGARATDEESLAFWIRQSTIGGGLIPVLMNGVRLAVVLDDLRWSNMMRHMRGWLLASAGVVILSQTRFFLVGATMPSGGQTVGLPEYGPGFVLFVLYLVGSLLALLRGVIRDLRRIEGVRKTEVHFLVLGWIGSLFLAIVFVVLPQVMGDMELGMFLPLSDIFRVGIIAYGIAKTRILDAGTFIRRLIAYMLVLTYLSVIYYLVLRAGEFMIPPRLKEQLVLHHLLATLAVAFSLAPLHGMLQSFVGRVFFNTQIMEAGDFVRRASQRLGSISTIDELVRVVNDLVRDRLGAESSRLLIEENGCYVEANVTRAATERAVVLPPDSPIVLAVKRYHEALVREMFSRRADPVLAAAGTEMKKLGVHLAAGIFSKHGLEGIMLLGARLSGRIYGLMEQQAIEGLCAQFSISLENAKLYTEVQNSRIYNDILLDRLVGGVAAVNTARQVTVFNREAQRITGIDKDVVAGGDIGVLPAPLREGLEHAFAHGGSRDMEAVLEIRGREVPVRYSATCFHGHDGGVLGALMVFTDQSEVKKLEYQIRRTDRLASLGTLAAGMAHEIKNPLVSLKTFSQLLPERYEDPDFRDTFSALLGDEVSRIDRIVNQLLKFARPAKPSLAPISLHLVLDNTLNLVKQQMRQRNINCIRQYRAETNRILGDADMLAQAILNFLLNAFDAMTDGQGELILRTEVVQENTNQLDLWGRPVQSACLRLSIIDNGKGIAPEDQPHVFDPFFTTKASGTGLGLSVSHGIIMEHHGIIDLESEPGRGTSLSISFPLVADEKRSEATA